jgi:hypothetical protein
MRYLLIVVGMFGLLLGFAPGPATPGWIFALVGAIFLAVGLATVDIVAAIKATRP